MTDDKKPLTRSTASRNLRDLTPMGPHKAADLAARLLDGYPYLNLANPKGYMAALTEILSRYPLWVGQLAIERIDPDRNQDFLPSDRMMRKWCEEIVQPARDLVHWNEKAKLSLPPPSTPQALPSPEEQLRASIRYERQQSSHMQRVLADIEARKKARESA